MSEHMTARPMTEGEREEALRFAKRLKQLAQHADAAPWSVRPQKYDDWGWIRNAEGYCVVQAKAGHDVDLDEHRRARTDPYKGNADFIAQARNDVEAVCDALLSTSAAVRGMREALEEAAHSLAEAANALRKVGSFANAGFADDGAAAALAALKDTTK